IEAVAGPFADLESMTLLKDLLVELGAGRFRLDGLGCRLFDSSPAGYVAPPMLDFGTNFRLNCGVAGLEAADAVLIVGADLRWEAPLLNMRLRKGWVEGSLQSVGLVGAPYNMTFDYDHLGDSPQCLLDSPRVLGFVETLCKARRPAIIVG